MTLAIETPLAAWLAPIEERRLVASVAFSLNLFSHPLACAAYWQGLASLPTIEVLVIAVEALGYRLVAKLGWGRALKIALLANIPTAALSLLLT